MSFQRPLPLFRWAKRLKDGQIVEDTESQEGQLVGDLVYVTAAGDRLVVPSGFLTDYASIPWIFWNLPGFNPYGPAKFPAVLHDFLYSLRGGAPYGLTRPECDALFLEAMASVGVGWVHRHIIFRSVRIFGGVWSMSAPWAKPPR